MQRPHQARESLFVALAGNPATAAGAGSPRSPSPPRHRAHLELARSAAAPGGALASALTNLRGSENRPNRRLEHEHNHRSRLRPPAAGSTGCRHSRRLMPHGSSRIRRHLDALHRYPSWPRPAGSRRVEEKLGQLRTRLAVAENSLLADVSAVDDVRGRRRGRAPQLGHLPRAAAGDGRRRPGMRASGPRRRSPTSAPTDRGLRPPRAGARGRQRHLARAEEPRQRGSRRARTEGRELEQRIRPHATAKP